MIITICNFKGGVGKTTTCHALATAKGIQGKKVLMVDLDAQHSLSTSCNINVRNQKQTLSDLLIAEIENIEYSIDDIKETIVHLDNIDIIPCSKLLNQVNNELTKQTNYYAVKKILDKVKNEYDYIFIDCSPTNNILIQNAIISSDGIIIPVESYFLGSEGLYDFIEEIIEMKSNFNLNVKILGIIVTMYQNAKICSTIKEYLISAIDKRNNQVQLTDNIEKIHINVYSDIVPRSVKVAEAGLYGKSIVEYLPKNPVSKAYINIANQI